ncbi:hypothetical protein [Paractinoplanes atraurantiacus]|uniref:SnoaL-like domain-containing protein n=1 Tax=Paractinoplanes atraurantiacus TaxID=1036182 RepID=A0A285GLG4_9ACTN|nr:hypothetical protein [Actinoplanes atraurantiacus]SNY24285.1 hypothetical protein SAMN05421748_102171 [Actinoplanes atraurantiacus]
MTNSAIAHLIDEAAVRDAIVRFADVAVRGDYDAFRARWSEDATWVIGDTATTRSMCHEAARGPGESYYRNNGVWTDTFRRTRDGWVFTNRTFQYLWLDFSPFTGDISWPGTGAR